MNTLFSKKTVLAVATLMTSVIAFGQETTEKKTTFSGSLDTYYRYSFDHGSANNYTSFTNSSNSFELGMASVAINHSFGKASAVADIGFGKRAQEFSYNDVSTLEEGELVNNTHFLIKQLYLNYAITPELTVTAGSWATHIGMELINPVDNRNYSMSYAFTNGPFFHTGLKANYVADKFNFMLGVANPTDIKSAFDSTIPDNKQILAQIGYTGEKTSAYLNAVTGANNNVDAVGASVTTLGLTATHKLNDKFGLGFDAIYNTAKANTEGAESASWYSLVGYVKYDPADKIALTYRGEYMADGEDKVKVGANVFANTVTLGYKVGDLTIMPELRYESASEDIFADNEGMGKNSAFSFLMGATYRF